MKTNNEFGKSFKTVERWQQHGVLDASCSSRLLFISSNLLTRKPQLSVEIHRNFGAQPGIRIATIYIL